MFASETDQGAFRPRNFNSVLRYQGDDKRVSLVGYAEYLDIRLVLVFQKRKIEEIVDILNANGIPLRVTNSRDQVVYNISERSKYLYPAF